MEVTLATERLLLRAFRGSDLDAYATMCADPIRVAEKLGERLTGEVDLLGAPSLVYELRRA